MSRTAAIIGTGVIGAGWAARFLMMGWDVRLFDPAPGARRRARATLENARRALPMLYDTALPAEGRLTWCETISEAVAGAEWIQESVPERLSLKRKTFQKIQQHCRPDALIASSASGFTPSALQGCATRPEQIIVAHPFNPVYLLPLVELVPSAANPPDLPTRAAETLRGLGMVPLVLRREIDAHIADRLLEALWREALWLIADGIATTGEIDDAIRYGFGLRWAQMGLFETYRIAGGEGGMRHFLKQFGPCLERPWSHLTEVPALTDDLIDTIAAQSDAQSGAASIADLERRRDDNLIAILRALRGRGDAAGAQIRAHEERLRPARREAPPAPGPLVTVRRAVPIDWTDYNGHMNESRYGQVFSDAADEVMALIGADADYIARGLSYFTVDIHIAFRAETLAGQMIRVETRVLEGEGKKLRLAHRMVDDASGALLAEAEQLLIHVSLKTRRSCPPPADVAARAADLARITAEGGGEG